MTQFIAAKHTTTAAPDLSPKYSVIQTTKVYELLADYGFREDKYRQSRERNREREAFSKHVSILQRDQDCDQHGGFNLLLVNSHNGTSSLHLEAGYFRVLCENQLGHGDLGIKVRHTGDVLAKLERAIPQVLAQMEDFKQLQAMLQGRTLSNEQAIALIEKALELRGLPSTTHNRGTFSYTRRNEGERNAWMQYNVIQENMVRGGMQVHAEDKDGLCVFRKLRALSSADRLLNANRELTATVRELCRAA
jgi:hypothetical protein